jgi:hypothetical protein
VPLAAGRPPLVLAVLRCVDGSRLSMHAVAPAVTGELLGRLHRILNSCPAAGAWTPGDVLGHMTRGITARFSYACCFGGVRQPMIQSMTRIRCGKTR